MHRRVCLGRVPILTFHSVRRRHTETLGPGGELTLPEEVFVHILRGLRRRRCTAVTCAEIHRHLAEGAPLPPRPILLTFDDGYLDNWTIVAPLLRRHGLRGTVFVATDFLHPEADAVRPTLDERSDPPERGYLSATELRRLDAEGVLEIQSHTAGHGRLPIAGEVIDFHRPDARCWWLERSRCRPDQLAREEFGGRDGVLPWGAPVHPSEWASAARAVVPDPALAERLCAAVADGGGEAFFALPDWRRRLERIVAEGDWRHRPEREDERRARIRADLGRGKETLEGILGHPVDYLAWPGGGSSPVAVRIAIDEIGFRATFGTDRVCAGVAPGPEAIPRAYFRQVYRGRAAQLLRAWHALGVAGWEGGSPAAYLRLFAANRLMGLLADPSRPNRPGAAQSPRAEST
ncbi:MAG: hypothetical protein D6702_05275 [Planctomycetota bacterium]|nr:MAG: hypothetical protein D6702_05275 [Planctomycetota bacterium]